MELYYSKQNDFYLFLNDLEEVIETPCKFIANKIKSPRYSADSRSQYANVLKQFLTFIEKKVHTDVEIGLKVLTLFDIENYLMQMQSQKSMNTVRNHDAIIKNFIGWIGSKECGINTSIHYPSRSYLSPSPYSSVPKYFGFDQVVNFINEMYTENQKCMAHCLFDTGLRVTELTKLKYKEVPKLNDIPDGAKYVDAVIQGVKGRNSQKKERSILLSRPLVERIHLLHKRDKMYRKQLKKYGEDMPCFLNEEGNPLTKHAVQDLFRKVSKRLKMDPKKYSPHKFRHSFAVAILSSELDESLMNKLVIAQRALGHSQIKTTEIYTSIPIAALQMGIDGNYVFRDKFEEALLLFETTYLKQRDHKERRGRKRGYEKRI